MPDNLILNTSQASRKLGLAKSTLAKMRLYGTGPAYLKLGRRVAYRVEDIEMWVLENRFSSTSEYPAK